MRPASSAGRNRFKPITSAAHRRIFFDQAFNLQARGSRNYD
jgi:hypothetical protein